MRGDDSIIGRASLTPAQQRCTSTPPPTGFTPPLSSPPSNPPASGGFCPPSRQYVYVDDALGYLTVAQRDEALRTGELPDGLPTIPADACTPGQPGTVASTPPTYSGGETCDGGFFPMESGGPFDDDPDFAPMSEAGSYSSAYCAPHYGGSFYASFSGGVGVVDFSTIMNNTSVDIFSTIVSGSASDADAIGSLRAGYDHAFPTQIGEASAITIGVFIDQTFGEVAATTGDIDPHPAFNGRVTSTVNMLGSLNARAGLAFGMALPYVTAGVSWAEVDALAFDPTTALAQNFSSEQPWGWNIGAGVEYFITPQWTSWAEVRYHSLETDFPGVTNNPSSFDPFTIDYSITTVQAGVAYRF
jgi:outer membrane immunogenic protein